MKWEKMLQWKKLRTNVIKYRKSTMQLNLTLTLLATTTLAANPVVAQGTITYECYALGGLVEVEIDGGPADNVTSGLTFE
jgi:hypothetical protein